MKARKRAGSEGFLVLFHVRNARDYWQWNIGGWNNTRSAVQRHEGGDTDEIGEATDTTVEMGRWYDVRIELHGTDIKCYLDDKLITEVTDTPRAPVSPLYVAASRVTSSGEVILKVVNISEHELTTQINLEGIAHVEPYAEGSQLLGKPEDQNSLSDPEKIAPLKLDLDNAAKHFSYKFPAYSVSVIRLAVKT